MHMPPKLDYASSYLTDGRHTSHVELFQEIASLLLIVGFLALIFVLVTIALAELLY